MVTLAEKQKEILNLFKKLTALTLEKLPEDQWDPLLTHKGIGVLPRGTLFSCFHEKHLREATNLFKILYKDAETFDVFLKLAKQARQIVNEGLFTYALSVAVVHRDDCKGVILPPIQEVFPDRFIPAETINRALKEAKNNPEKDTVVEVQETGNILDPEYKLFYFREDVGCNAHHWFWHVVYPANWDDALTGKHKDRKGELFYYMHQQMCARYDCERLSNGLTRMTPFHNFEEKLEGYAPHLTSLVSGLHYASRPKGLTLCDLPEVKVQDLERWRDRIVNAIQLHHVHNKKNEDVPLDIEHGADILGAIIEASHDSLSKQYYGSLHNWGHVAMARMTDPDGKFGENPGVMSDTSTSLRDPIFYRWHRFVDNIFQAYKATLPHYTHDDLNFPGIKIASLEIKAKSINVIRTHYKDEELELSHGIEFGTEHSVKVHYRHLDHEPFSYTIHVENNSGVPQHCTVRIFLGPKCDELGNILEPDDQRRLFIELDKFHKPLAPGKNTLTRNSVDSTVTLSHTYTFDELEKGVDPPGDGSEYCNCGWPRHMLVPKGTHQGLPFQFFVMLTDYTVDNPGADDDAKIACGDAVSYCGSKEDKYPDTKPMGFPFDRPVTAHTAEELLTPNMSLLDVTITFDDDHHD